MRYRSDSCRLPAWLNTAHVVRIEPDAPNRARVQLVTGDWVDVKGDDVSLLDAIMAPKRGPGRPRKGERIKE